MAELLEDKKVKLGVVIKVKNSEEGATQNKVYHAIQVEDQNGDNECCMLLTEKEYNKLSCINPPEKLLKEFTPGRIYPITQGKRHSNWIRLIDDNLEFLAQMSDKLIIHAISRGDKHPDSITKKSFMEDLLD